MDLYRHKGDTRSHFDYTSNYMNVERKSSIIMDVVVVRWLCHFITSNVAETYNVIKILKLVSE